MIGHTIHTESWGPAMASQEKFERVYPVPADVLFGAFREAVTQGKYKKADVDEFTKTVVFRSSPSPMSWGHQWQGQVTTGPEGVKLSMTADLRASSAMATGGKRAADVASKLFADISRRCALAVS